MLIKTDNVLTMGEVPRKTNSKDCSELRLLKVAKSSTNGIFLSFFKMLVCNLKKTPHSIYQFKLIESENALRDQIFARTKFVNLPFR